MFQEDDWYFEKHGELKGPYSFTKFKTMFQLGQVRMTDKILGGDLVDLTLLSTQKKIIKVLGMKT